MKLNSDIQDLIDQAKTDLKKIKIEYQKALNDKEISVALKIAIKNCLENVRSSLDYLGNQIFEENCTKNKSKGYYPVFNEDKPSFEKFMSRTYPDLEKNNPAMYSALESNQFYNNKNENNWMKDLVILVNENKHRKLSPQTKEEKKTLSLSAGNARMDIGENASIKMGKNTSMRIGGKTIYGGQTISTENQNIIAEPGVDVKRITWVNFRFDEIEKSVIPTITQIVDGAQNLIDEFS